MIASPVPIVILFLLPVCCGAIVIFGLLLRRRVIIGSLGIAALVLCIVGAAFWGARPGRLAGAWPRARWAHLPAVLHAKIPPEVRLLDSDLAEIERSGQEVVLPVIVQAKVRNGQRNENVQKATGHFHETLEEALVYQLSVTSGDEAAISLFSEHSQLPPVVVELRDSEKSSERIITPFTDSTGYGSAASTVLMALAIASFLGVGYVFLDAGTRGQFTWSLRVAAAVAFAGVWVAMSSLR